MFVVTVVFEIERDAVDHFMKRIRQQADDTLALEPKCHRFNICIDTKRSDRILLYEIYDDAAAFASHLDSDHFKSFDAETSPNVRSKKVESWSLT